MKQKYFTLVGLLFILSMSGQVIDTTLTNQKIKDKILTDIQSTLDKKTQAIDMTVATIDKKLDGLDRAIKDSKNATDKADKLLERVQSIEKKQSTVEENELNVYQANYQSAIVNLVSMDRDVKQLMLFNTSRLFFSALTETSNPMNYPGYKEWYQKFYDYIEKQKKQESNLFVLSNLLSLTGDLTKGSPLTGPLSMTLFSGIGSFINSLGGSNSKKEIREESEKMFILTAKLSQFTHDKDIIEHEWESISKELQELQSFYDSVLTQNLILIGVSKSEFQSKFSNEYDANNSLKYLLILSKKAAELVSKQKSTMPKDWKEAVFYEQMDVQSLKLKFGKTTYKISENIGRYNGLIEKYKKDPDVGAKVLALESKLKELQIKFDQTFRPIECINAATRMYKVN